jgi:hypothetical protein
MAVVQVHAREVSARRRQRVVSARAMHRTERGVSATCGFEQYTRAARGGAETEAVRLENISEAGSNDRRPFRLDWNAPARGAARAGMPAAVTGLMPEGENAAGWHTRRISRPGMQP